MRRQKSIPTIERDAFLRAYFVQMVSWPKIRARTKSLAGAAWMAAGVSSWEMRPASMTSTRLPRPKASLMSWVTVMVTALVSFWVTALVMLWGLFLVGSG